MKDMMRLWSCLIGFIKSKTRRVLFKMVSVSIKRKDIEDAQYFLQEYELAAPMTIISLFSVIKLIK